jgi:hypothetical protein
MKVKKNKPEALWLSNINFFWPALSFFSSGVISEKAEANDFRFCLLISPLSAKRGFFMPKPPGRCRKKA